jgi:DNA-binding transcriptional MerR regulator
MSDERLTIGELSRRTGASVKTLRFYSDEGLLPLAGRTSSSYRLYATQALVRVDLIRTLRHAGLSLSSIKKVLCREMPLADALRLQLATIETHVASLQRISAALRAALRMEPSEDDLKRIYAVTRLSNEGRRNVIEQFYDRVSQGLPIDEAWKQRMIEASTPKLPDNPTPSQLDAWIELAEMLSDPTFIENTRDVAKVAWGKFDMEALRCANDEVATAAKDALGRSILPESEEAKYIVERHGAALATARGGVFDHRTRRELHETFAQLVYDARRARYWELVGILNGGRGMWSGTVNERNWVKAAVLHKLATVRTA